MSQQQIYLQLAQLHFFTASKIRTSDGEWEDLSLGKVIGKELFLKQHLIVNWTFLPCIPAMKIGKY